MEEGDIQNTFCIFFWPVEWTSHAKQALQATRGWYCLAGLAARLRSEKEGSSFCGVNGVFGWVGRQWDGCSCGVTPSASVRACLKLVHTQH